MEPSHQPAVSLSELEELRRLRSENEWLRSQLDHRADNDSGRGLPVLSPLQHKERPFPGSTTSPQTPPSLASSLSETDGRDGAYEQDETTPPHKLHEKTSDLSLSCSSQNLRSSTDFDFIDSKPRKIPLSRPECVLASTGSSVYDTEAETETEQSHDYTNEVVMTQSSVQDEVVVQPISHIVTTNIPRYSIRVDTGLLAHISPPSSGLTFKRKPCAVFYVVNVTTDEICWRFSKDYNQLKRFREELLTALRPLIKRGELNVRYLPPREMFSTMIPWKADVRNDMMNAFFEVVEQVNDIKKLTTYNHRDTVEKNVKRLLNTFWFSDNVEKPRTLVPPIDSVRDSEMSGYLLSRASEMSSWECNYYIINGAFLDLVDQRYGNVVKRSIPLDGASTVRVVVFFDTTPGDARYVFEVCENPDKQTTQNRQSKITFKRKDKKENLRSVHTFTAESGPIRANWLKKINLRIAQINSGEIAPETRFYKIDDIPMLYLPKKNSHNHKPNETMSLESHTHRSDSVSSRHSQMDRSASTLHGDSNSEKSSFRNDELFDGGEFYMSIAKDYDIDQHPLTKPISREESYNSSKFKSIVISNPSGFSYHNISERSGRLASIPNSPIRCLQYSPTSVSLPRSGSGPVHMNGEGSPNTTTGLRSNSRNTSEKSSGALFGVPPKDCQYMLRSINGIPVPNVIARCVEGLMQRQNLVEVGVFRISGSQKIIDELREQFDNVGDVDLVKMNVEVSVMADLMKRYLRMLPHNSFGKWPSNKTGHILSLSGYPQLEFIRNELVNIEKHYLNILRVVLRLLYCISREQDKNAMSLRNLGVALSPALQMSNVLLEVFISHEKELFAMMDSTLAN